MNQAGAVIEGNDGDLTHTAVGQSELGQTRRNASDLFLNAVQDLQWIGAVTHSDYAANHFMTILVKRTTTWAWT